jgi:hypothetical protein
VSAPVRGVSTRGPEQARTTKTGFRLSVLLG